jgi:hypothetical protein
MIRAVENDPYSKAGSDYSVTQLIDPPQLRRLLRDHAGEIETDVSEQIWMLYGQAMHSVLERAARPTDIVEQRFYMPTDYGVISGQIDLYETDTGTLSDSKVTSVWKVKRSLKEPIYDWEMQLNFQAQLMRYSGIYPKKLQIVAICRDWSLGGARREKDYPQRAVTIPIEMWDKEKAQIELEKRAELHWQVMENDHDIPCSDEECWKKEDGFAVMRKGRKRADRVFYSLEATRQYLMDHGLAEMEDGKYVLSDDIYIETRPGSYARCEDYCQVAKFCPQFNGDRND